MTDHIDEEEVKRITGAWDYTALPSNARIGRDCFLERRDSFKRFRSTREPGLVLGDRVAVHTWTEFNVEENGMIAVGDDAILVGAIFMCAGAICIGSRVVVSYNVTIADCDFHPTDPELRKQDARAIAPFAHQGKRPSLVSMPVIIEDDVWIGMGAMILKGVHIGQRARIQPGTVVTSNVPAGAIVAGNPGRIVSAMQDEHA